MQDARRHTSVAFASGVILRPVGESIITTGATCCCCTPINARLGESDAVVKISAVVYGCCGLNRTGLGIMQRTGGKMTPRLDLLEVRWRFHLIQGSSLGWRKSPNKSCFGPTTWIKPIRDWRKVYFCLRAIFCLDGNRVPRSPDLCWGNKIWPPRINMKIPSQNDYRRQLLVQLEYPRHHYPIYFLLFSRKFNISSILDIGAHGNANCEYSIGVSRRDVPLHRIARKFVCETSNLSFVRLG